MTQQLHASGLEWERVGIDFRRAESGRIADELKHRFPGLRFDLRSQSGAELGCWASHLCAWQRLLASDKTAMTVIGWWPKTRSSAARRRSARSQLVLTGPQSWMKCGVRCSQAD